YDMAAIPGLTCPECGRAARDERALFRTRRRWRWVAAGTLLALLAAAAPLAPDAIRGGGRPAIPSAVLVRIAPMDDGAWNSGLAFFGRPPFISPRDALLAELIDRSNKRQLSPSQWQVFWDRLFQACPEQTAGMLLARDAWPCGVRVMARIRFP